MLSSSSGVWFGALKATTLLFVVPAMLMGTCAAQATEHSPFWTTPAVASTVAHRFTVAVLGDGFAEALTEGLKLNHTDRNDIVIVQETHSPFGLAQEDRFEWLAAVSALLAGKNQIDAAVFMLGANDTAPLKDGQATIDPDTPRWRELYGNRVEAVATLFREKAIPLTWVGLPIVQDEDLAAKFAALNEIVRDRVTKAGASYVDSWGAFVDEGGRYNSFGPDLNGRMAKLRTADGVDFTRAGVRKLSSFVEPDLRRDQQRQESAAATPESVVIPEQPEFDKALQIDVNAQIRREAGLPALPSAEASRQTRTLAGPVILITAPVVASDGRLADLAPGPSPLLDGDRALQRSLVEGQPIQPKPGRIDDFSWPRP